MFDYVGGSQSGRRGSRGHLIDWTDFPRASTRRSHCRKVPREHKETVLEHPWESGSRTGALTPSAFRGLAVEELSRHFRQAVLITAEVQYVEEQARLVDILDWARRAMLEGADRTRADFDSDENFFLAVVKRVEVVGETASRLTSDTRRLMPEVPWAAVAATRNRLVHAQHKMSRDREAEARPRPRSIQAGV